MANKRISLTKINDTDQRYQNRDTRTGSYGEAVSEKLSSKSHIKTLVKSLMDNPEGNLETIEVTHDPSNKSDYIIVDGFHRYAAYKEVNRRTKGKRFKQIRVKIHEEVSVEKALSINAENRTKSLTASQQTEIQWQKFLVLMRDQPDISIKNTANTIGVAQNTVSNWRKAKREFIEAGYFEKKSHVAHNEVTGFPILKQARSELIKAQFKEPEPETEGQLKEADKTLLQTIIKAAKKAKEPEKLLRAVNLYWGENPNYVDYDANLDESENYEF